MYGCTFHIYILSLKNSNILLEIEFKEIKRLIFCPMPYLLLLLIALSSCSSPSYDYDILGADEFVIDSYKIRQGKLAILEMEGFAVEELPCDAMEEYKDVVAEDDLLNIVIFHPTRKDLMGAFQSINQSTGGFKVTHGRVDIPDVDSIEVVGLTLDEAKEKIQGRFRDHIKDVEVFVTYRDRLKSKVELAGLVQTPTVPVDGKIRLFEVLAKAKIAPQANLFMSYVVRDCKPLPLDLHQLVNQGDMSQNIVMRGGDKIFIANPSDATVMMMGEVGEPRPINLPYGFISLREALVVARGIPYTGDRNRIQVIRGNLQCPKIYVLSWKHIIHLPNDSLLLMPGDTVYVSAKPITEWNQFISQLFPSMQGLQSGYTIYNLVSD